MYYLLYFMIKRDYVYFMINVVFFCFSNLLTIGSIYLVRICISVGVFVTGRIVILMMVIIGVFMALLGR